MIDIIIIILYLAVILGVGLWSGRNIKNLEHFSVSQRNFTTFIIFATLSASFIGGGFSLGNAEKVFRLGIINIVALWGFSLKEILVAKFIAPKVVAFPKAISIGDIVERAFGRYSRPIVGILSIALCAGIVGAQVSGIGYIFNVFLGVPVLTGILIGCGIVILYSTIGGMSAVVKTDVIQFIVLSVGLPLTLILGFIYMKDTGSTASISNHLSFSFSNMSLIAFISLFLTFVLGETMVPPYVQRLLIGKDNKSVIKGTMLSGIFSIPFFAITGLIGVIAFALKPDLEPNLAMPFVVKTVLPIGIKGIVIAGIISIVMSSADSFLNSASIAFTNDVLGIFVKNINEKAKLNIARLMTFVTGVLAVVFAVTIESVLDILIYAYNFWAPLVLVQIIAAIFGVKSNMRTFLVPAFLGLITMIVWNHIGRGWIDLDGLVFGVFANLVTFVIIYKLEKKV